MAAPSTWDANVKVISPTDSYAVPFAGGRRRGISSSTLILRAENRRLTLEQVAHGSALRSQSLATAAQELEAKAMVLQSRLKSAQASAEMDEAIGRTPR